jgi:hypothetical protein
MAGTQSLLPGAPPSGVRPSAPKNLRKVFVGIPVLAAIGAAASADVPVPVLEPFRLDRPVLSPDSQALLVNNIRVGTKPLNVSSNPISGNAFSEQAINNELSGYTAQPGTGITLSVTNPTAAGIVLKGGFLGWAAL